MIKVMSFSKDKHEKFCKCPKCHNETKHRKLTEEELKYKEILNMENNKHK